MDELFDDLMNSLSDPSEFKTKCDDIYERFENLLDIDEDGYEKLGNFIDLMDDYDCDRYIINQQCYYHFGELYDNLIEMRNSYSDMYR